MQALERQEEKHYFLTCKSVNCLNIFLIEYAHNFPESEMKEEGAFELGF